MGQVTDKQAREVNGYHRRGTNKLLIFALCLLVINFGLMGIGFYAFFTRDKMTDYYAVTCNSDPVKLDSLGVAVVGKKQLLNWAHASAIAIYNFNYGNWKQKADQVRPLFTQEGWQSFYPNFKASQIDPAIEKSTFVTAVATDVPVIERQGALNGIYRWRVAIPLLISYQTASDKAEQRVTLRMVVSRVPSVQNPRGIAIVGVSVDRAG